MTPIEPQLALIALSEAATPGPWSHEHRRSAPDDFYRTQLFDSSGETIATFAWHPVKKDNGLTVTDRAENAEFIAALVNWFRANYSAQSRPEAELPELVKELRALRIRYVALFDIYIRPTYTHDAAADSDLALGLSDTDAALAKFSQAGVDGVESNAVTNEMVERAANAFLANVADHQKSMEVDLVAMRAALQAAYGQQCAAARQTVKTPALEGADMAMHWIDRYAAGIDDECQLDRVKDALMASADKAVGYVGQDGSVTFYVDDFSYSRQPKAGTELYTRPAEVGGDGWLPIESAPKDGTFILLATEYGVVMCGWDEQSACFGNDFCEWENPTHWQPLPPAPGSEAKS